MIIFALIAIAVSDPSVAVSATQTIQYYPIISECQKDKNKIEQTINKSYVRLDCVPIKITDKDE